ncbi:MAG: dihydroxyacetone kinase subunit DhaK [Oscillospiraceae bacterium]
MEMSYPERWKKFSGDSNSAALVKKNCTPDQIAVIISGGAANGPLFPGYVTDGLADAAVVGAPYAAPNAYAIYEVGRSIGKEKGVLLLYNNFAGDYLNNDMAQELLEMDGIQVESVVLTDDIASALGEARSCRSGRCGITLLTKIAGSCASKGWSLKDTASLLRKANGRVSTLSILVDFEKREVTYGNGFSGEPGLMTVSDISMKSVAVKAMKILTEDLKPQKGEKLFLLVNRMRNASYSDSFRITKFACEYLSLHYDIMRTRVANYSNIIDVYGFDFCILCADEELAAHLGDTIYTDSFII